MLYNIDVFIANYICRYANDINRELNMIPNNMNCIEMYKYDNILKHIGNNYELHLKSYLDNKTIQTIKNIKNDNTEFILTFNISNIYFGPTSLIPLVKCNKCIATVNSNK